MHFLVGQLRCGRNYSILLERRSVSSRPLGLLLVFLGKVLRLYFDSFVVEPAGVVSGAVVFAVTVAVLFLCTVDQFGKLAGQPKIKA